MIIDNELIMGLILNRSLGYAFVLFLTTGCVDKLL